MPDGGPQKEYAWNTWESLASDIQTTRGIERFACEEIIVPNGPYAGQFYSSATQPFIRHYFAAIDSGRYQRFAAVGPTQSGKTLSCSVIPTLWHIFEHGDDTIYGAPTIEIAKDKWSKDFGPVIHRTRYAELMPRLGTGARGGTPTGINFLNGASLRFMTGGGSDKTVAGYTARAINITEVDGMDMAGETSREADRISQLEVRGDAYGLSKRIYLECTASIEEGRIWYEYLHGTHTRIEKQCPYCQGWVVPEREHLRGIDDSPTERTVLEDAYFVCPACDHPLTRADRVAMMHGCRVSHDNPESLTFSFRWNAFDNLFWTVGEIGLDEWRFRAAPANKRDDLDRVQHQFKWAIPIPTPTELDLTAIDDIQQSEQQIDRFDCPWKPDYLTAGVDVGKHYLSWVLVAHKGDQHHIVDYGRTDCPSQEFGENRGVRSGLDELADMCGVSQINHEGEVVELDVSCVDYGYLSDVVYGFTSALKNYYACKGCGMTGGYRDPRYYRAPNKRTQHIAVIGDKWDMRLIDNGRKIIMHDVDYGKLAVVAGLQTPRGEPGAITLFSEAYENEHLTFLKHMKSEQLLPDKKGKLVWQRISKNNHWLDAMTLAMLAWRLAPHTKMKPKVTAGAAKERGVKTKTVSVRNA